MLTINLLVTIDKNYLKPLEVMLTSLHSNDLENGYHIWLLHRNLTNEQIAELNKFIQTFGWQFNAIKVPEGKFTEPKTTKRYPQEMYYRLLCGELLPIDVKRVIYLDPDLLTLDSLTDLWNIDLHDNIFAAAAHIGMTDMTTNINKIRLGKDHPYFNSGVLVIDVDEARKLVSLDKINEVLTKYENELLLPDQDVLNYLYGDYILQIDEERWNYDARKYLMYLTRSGGQHDIHWLMDHNSILHFCGKPKPWEPEHDNHFTALYLTYRNQALKVLTKINKNKNPS